MRSALNSAFIFTPSGMLVSSKKENGLWKRQNITSAFYLKKESKS